MYIILLINKYVGNTCLDFLNWNPSTPTRHLTPLLSQVNKLQCPSSGHLNTCSNDIVTIFYK